MMRQLLLRQASTSLSLAPDLEEKLKEELDVYRFSLPETGEEPVLEELT